MSGEANIAGNQQIDAAVATASTGTVKSDAGGLDLTVVDAGASGGTTPEHLMAAALAACLQQALDIAASSQDVDASDTSVQATVTLQAAEGGGYSASFDLAVTGLDASVADRVLQQATQFCPFTKAPDGRDLTVRTA